MNFNQRCSHCEQIVTAYTHNLNVSLVRALRQLVNIYEANKRPVKKDEMSLDHSQYGNFQKLQYFELAKYIDNTGWVPTEHGLNFIHGESYAVTPVATMANKVLPLTHPAWQTHNAKPQALNVKQIDVVSYKQRRDYQAEKSIQPNLFNKRV